ncbi:MAG: Peptide chain release factor 2 [Lachnoclostridium sp.]|jgi:hypothetical protein
MKNTRTISNTYYYEDMLNRISRPKIQLFTLERVRLDINKMITDSDDLFINPELEEKGKCFDNLLNTCYDLGEI